MKENYLILDKIDNIYIKQTMIIPLDKPVHERFQKLQSESAAFSSNTFYFPRKYVRQETFQTGLLSLRENIDGYWMFLLFYVKKIYYIYFLQLTTIKTVLFAAI